MQYFSRLSEEINNCQEIDNVKFSSHAKAVLDLLNLAILAADAKFAVLYIDETGETISTKELNVEQKNALKLLEEKVLKKRKPFFEICDPKSLAEHRQATKLISRPHFYAGFPLMKSDMSLGGVLSVFHQSAVSLSRKQQLMLKNITRQIVGLCERAKNTQETGTTPTVLQKSDDFLTDHFKLAQSLLKTGSWEFDQASERISWSPEACRILGVNKTNFTSTLEEFISYIHPDDRGSFILTQERFVRHQLPYAIKHRILCLNGEIAQVFNRAEVICKNNKKRFIGTIINLSESLSPDNPYVIHKKESAAFPVVFDEKNYFRALFKASPEPYLVLTPDDFRIVAVNQAYLNVTRTQRKDIIGHKMFDIFPDDPNDPDATGVKNLRASLVRVREHGEIDIMAVQRYPIRIPEESGGGFEERYWMPINSPVLNEDGSVASIIHRVEDVTEYIHSRTWSGIGASEINASHDDIGPKGMDIVLRSMELKQYAEKATENERRFRSAFTNSLVGMSIATLDGRFVECNSRLLAMTGYSEKELLGMSIKDITHPDDWTQNEKMLRELIYGNCKAFEIKKRYLHKSGKLICGLNYVSAILDGNAKPYRLFGVTIDITEEQNAKQKLLQHEELLRIGEKIAHVGSWSYDAEGKERWYWSDELYEIHGLSPSMPLSFATIINFFVPHWQLLFKTANEECIANGTPYDLEAEILNAQGQRVWVRIIGEAKRNDEGKIIGAHGAYLDISKVKRNEAALREQATLLDAATDAIVVRSLDDRILYWNRAAEKQYGWKVDEVLGRPVKDVLYSESDIPFEEALEKVKKDGEFFGQIVHVRKNGSKVVVQSHWTLVRHDDGSPKSILAIHTDISERLDLEQKMMEMQKLNALGQLTGGIAHDFNNLLTIINGSAEILTEEPENVTLTRELAHAIYSAGERGAQLTNRLLAFARRQDLEPSVVDLRTIVTSMAKMLQRTLGEHMHLSTRFSNDIWPAFLDEAQFESALLNLCINSRDAMPNGGEVKIEIDNASLDKRYIETNPDAQLGDYVLVSVADTGTGMTPEVVSRAFEPFFTTKHIGQGSGLGLSMVYGFIAQSNGHIKIASHPGQGTVVKMYFPRASAAALPQPNHRASTHVKSGAGLILMVEDNELVKAHGKNLLEELGYHVQTASNGREAMVMLQNGDKYDLLFTDILMPHGLNGFELAKKAIAICPNIRILFTSGYSEAASCNSRKRKSKCPMLHKPYKRKDLADKIREALYFQGPITL